MTYKRIFDLKFREGYSTGELMRRFPKEATKVKEVALIQIPTPVLRKTLPETHLLKRILSLKKKFLHRSN